MNERWPQWDATMGRRPRYMRNASGQCLALGLACLLSAAHVLAQAPITFKYSYDELGQLTRVVDSTGIVIDYVYDSVGNILEIKRVGVDPTKLTVLGFSPSRGGIGT